MTRKPVCVQKAEFIVITPVATLTHKKIKSAARTVIKVDLASVLKVCVLIHVRVDLH